MKFIANIGSLSIPVTVDKALQIKSLQVLMMCQKKGFSYTLSQIRSMFILNPAVSSVMLFEQIVLAESLKDN